MFQNLRPFISENEVERGSESVHYLMQPEARSDLIEENIERSVGRMQSVIDIGRILRDRRTMPVKYPLPEAVVIHKDSQCLDDIRSLEKYVVEELNVKKVTLSSNKAQYGVKLRAEPDHKTLGLRLKGAFKAVMAEIKGLSDEVLTEFLQTGSMKIQGHDIGPQDIRIMYTFDSADKSLAEKYEAHSEGDVLVLLDCTPDKSMLDEGNAREVINRVQKLRKKSNLTPMDEVTVYYTLTPPDHDLGRVIREYAEYIEIPTKSPICPKKEELTNVIGQDKYDLKGAQMELFITKGFPKNYSRAANLTPAVNNGVPLAPYVNLVSGSSRGALFLNNNGVKLNYDNFVKEIEALFDLKSAPELFHEGNSLNSNSFNINKLNGETVTVNSTTNGSKSDGCCCKFVNVVNGSKNGCVFLENPAGESVSEWVPSVVASLFNQKISTFYNSKDKKKIVNSKMLNGQNGKTLYV